jgi:ribose transport system substrate-binding protein
MKKLFVALLLITLVFSVVFAQGAKEPTTKKGGWRIALSNDYAGNSWRQTMISDFEKVAKIALDQGLIAEATVFTTNESSSAEQAAQIQNLILEGYDAIVLNAASATALNGAVRQAVDAGIVVVSFDNVVTEEKAWRLVTDFQYAGAAQVEWVANRFDKATLLEIRGLSGTYVNDAIHEGIQSALKNYPNLKVVGEVYGDWTQSVAQREVAGILPSLPKIDAVLTQGGDGYGAAKAFEAAGREMPLIIMGNRYDELVLWKELDEKGGYDTMSITIPPGTVTIAFWMALEQLNGNDVPKYITTRPLTILRESLDYHIGNTTPGGVASMVYPQKWVQDLIAAYKAGDPPPADPIIK